MSPELAALAGASIGLIGSIVVTVITSRIEERKHNRALIYQAGIENYKEACEMARRSGGKISPMEDFILNIAVIAGKLSKQTNLTQDEVITILKESHQVSLGINAFRNRSKMTND